MKDGKKEKKKKRKSERREEKGIAGKVFERVSKQGFRTVREIRRLVPSARGTYRLLIYSCRYPRPRLKSAVLHCTTTSIPYYVSHVLRHPQMRSSIP